MDASRLPCRSHVLTCTLSVCSISTARVSASTHSRIRPTWDSSGSPKASYGQELLSTCRLALISSSVAMREKVHAQTSHKRQLLPVLDSVGSSSDSTLPVLAHLRSFLLTSLSRTPGPQFPKQLASCLPQEILWMTPWKTPKASEVDKIFALSHHLTTSKVANSVTTNPNRLLS